MTTCFDADVLIYAAVPGHPVGSRVARLFERGATDVVGVGSTLLLPEMLSKPLRDGVADEARALSVLLARLHLHPLDHATARLATALASRYRLRAADAAHLATAVTLGADRFLTNNRRDFTRSVSEVHVTYPDDLDADDT